MAAEDQQGTGATSIAFLALGLWPRSRLAPLARSGQGTASSLRSTFTARPGNPGQLVSHSPAATSERQGSRSSTGVSSLPALAPVPS